MPNSDEFTASEPESTTPVEGADDSMATAHTEDDSVSEMDTESEVERLKAELEDAKNRLLRSQAELENFRRRTRREMQDERRYANQPLLLDILPVLDNVERAIDAAQNSTDSSGLLEGVKMVYQQLVSVLEQHNCPRVDVQGPFDPTMHEAVAREASDEQPAGTVVRVNLHGYKLHDRVIRPAQVVVSGGPAESDSAEDDT